MKDWRQYHMRNNYLKQEGEVSVSTKVGKALAAGIVIKGVLKKEL